MLGGDAARDGGDGGRLFPGPARVIRPDMHEHLVVIFGLMAERRVHLEIGARSQRAISAWQNVFTQYFNPINGTGRAWAMWTTPPRTSLTKFRKSVMAGLEFHSAAFVKGEVAPTQVQILANDLMVECKAAIAAMEASVGQQVQHQGLLLAANRGMGLVPPGQGVLAPPNLGFDLTRNQELALGELAQRTRSVDTRAISDDGEDIAGLMPVAPMNPPGGLVAATAAAAPTPRGGLATSVAVAPATVATAAVDPIAVIPITVTTPAVAPAAVAPAAATPAAVAVGANRGVLGRDRASQRRQAFTAAGTIGDPQAVLPTGIRGRNPDQVGLLAQMNQEVARGIANLSSFLPSADERRQARLEAALTSANQRHSAALANGRSTVAIEQLIDRLENQLDAILNAI